MKKIGILSDTHSYLDEQVFEHFKDVDEIWHIGDFGSPEIVEKLRGFKPLKGVFGNIDPLEIRNEMPLREVFMCDDVKVYMEHIGGYPGKYEKKVKEKLMEEKPGIFLSGHSHILKVMYDEVMNCLHINPGAAGKEGWHKMRTIVRIDIEGNKISNLRIIELGKK